ncbi:MAG: 50S ribosomal protein L1 [Planctomycetota bacterium]|nr:50S ribosomal protein L1 [Planctomycetota bacterium]
MAYVSKRYRAAVATSGYEKHKRYDLGSALGVLAGFPKPKFDETVELAMRLGIDPKKSDQMIRGSVSLPKGIGKSRSVIVFAEGEAAKEAEEAGADAVGGEELAQRIQDGWMDFDVCIAHPAMMKVAGKLGRVLGPSGKMPSPKSGTVTPQVGQAVTEFKAGKVEFRADAGGIVHVPVGKRSFENDDLAANITHFVEHIRGLRPSAVKGTYIRKVSVSATMSPSVTLDIV